MIEIAPGVAIAEDEVAFQASRAGGPGGQNVNKVATRVTLLLDVAGSPSLSPEHKARIGERLSTRISKEGVLRVVSQRHRSQSANRQEAMERLTELLRWALSEEPPRKATRPSRQARRRRLEEKKRHGAKKRERAEAVRWDE